MCLSKSKEGTRELQNGRVYTDDLTWYSLDDGSDSASLYSTSSSWMSMDTGDEATGGLNSGRISSGRAATDSTEQEKHIQGVPKKRKTF